MTTPTSDFVVHPDAGKPGDGIWFATPPGFTHLPLEALAAPTGPGREALDEALAPLFGSAPDDGTRERLTSSVAKALNTLRFLHGEGTAHCSLGLHRDETGGTAEGVLRSLFTVTWIETAWAPRGVTAARAVATAEGHAHVAYAEVPCGPVTFSETLRTPAVGSGLPQDPLLQLYAHLPHPDGTSLALLTLSTGAVARREEYRAILRLIAETVSFEEPSALAGPVAQTACRPPEIAGIKAP